LVGCVAFLIFTQGIPWSRLISDHCLVDVSLYVYDKAAACKGVQSCAIRDSNAD